MSLRVVLVWVIVAVLSVNAWRRNWFISLCGLVVLAAVSQHPDMPRQALGIPGFSPWNLLCFNVFLAWLIHRRPAGLDWDMPRHLWFGLLIFIVVQSVAAMRLVLIADSLHSDLVGSPFTDFIINSIKYILPMIMLYDACRERRHVVTALASIVLLYVLLAIQVIRYVPVSMALSSGDELAHLGARMCQNEIGYSRVSMGMMLSGAFWAAFSFFMLFQKHRIRLIGCGILGILLLGQALTGGRTGYGTWGVVGLLLCLIRWRRFLPLFPILGIMVVLFVPSVRQRLTAGWGGASNGPSQGSDTEEITSGRSLVWPCVVGAIKKAPVLGYGRLGMLSSGVHQYVSDVIFGEEDFAHPHEAYLEVLLDTGAVGFVGTMAIYMMILYHSVRLLKHRADAIFSTVGGVGCSLVCALLVAGFGAQHFYPDETSLGMWAAVGVVLRVSVERLRWLRTGGLLFGEAPVEDPPGELSESVQPT